MLSYALLASGLIGLAAAAPAPRPQDIDFDLAYALPNPTSTVVSDATAQLVTYTPAAIFSSALDQITATNTDALTTATDSPDLAKRAAPSCTALPVGSGVVPSPDTASAFLSLSDYADAALNAQTPSGYTQTFANKAASNNAYGYLGYTNLKTYYVAKCAAKCSAINGCLAFNIYFERDPSVDPGSGSDCPNPASTTNIKCSWWGGPVTAENAVNAGQYRNQFQVVIAGSNGYVSNQIGAVPGYTTPVPLGNAAINAPYDVNGFNSFMGSAIFTSGPFNASLCAQACTQKSDYARAHPPTDGSPVQTCQFFNTYILYINSSTNPANNQGQYCAMYSESWPQKYATNVGQTRGNDKFMIQYSFMYSNATNPGVVDPNAAVYQASKDISWATLQPFCSSYLGFTVPVTTTQVTSFTTPVSTQYVSITATAPTPTVFQKRDDEDVVSSILAAQPDSVLSALRDPNGTYDDATTTDPSTASSTAPAEKRALATPDVLTKYPTAILSSACNLQATKPATSILTQFTTVTGSPSTTTITTAIATTTPAAICTKTSNTNIRLTIVAPGTPYDGVAIRNPSTSGYFLGLGSDPFYAAFPELLFNFDASTGYFKSAGTVSNYISWTGSNNGRLLMSAFLTNYKPVTCAIANDTRLVTCSSKDYSNVVNTHFYVTKNVYFQLSFGNSPLTVGNFNAVEVQLKASC